MNKKNNANTTIAFIAIVLGFFMALLDTTIVNITLPNMTEYFNTTVENISWVVNGYNIAFAVLIITASRLADQFGRKKIFIMGIIAFTLSSLLSGLSKSPEMLIFFRVIQGLSAALVVPVTIPLALNIFPPKKHGMVMGMWGAFAGLAAASGPSLGGIITQFLSWRFIFFINIPIGIISVLLTIKYIGESYDSSADRRIDLLGILAISIAVFSLTLALIEANDKGWTSTFIISLLIISLISFILFIIAELKVKSPMLPLSLFRIAPFTCGAIALFLLGLGMMAGAFFLAFFLTQVKGLSELSSGLIISTMALASILSSSISGPLTQKLGGRIFGTVGLALLALSSYLYSTLTQYSTNLDIILRLVVAGLGMGLAMSSIMGSMIRNVPKDKVGMTSGVNNMTRTLGTVLGVAVLLTLFNSSMTSEMSKAKDDAINIIKADTIFNNEAKTAMIGSLNSSKTTSTNSNKPNIDDIIKEINFKENETLKTVPQAMQDKVKQGFEIQKKETKIIFTHIETKFTDHTVAAFSSTFKYGFFILIPGIFFAFFSDKKVDKNLAYKEKEASLG
ncbi:tetracenomycin C resistance and export protein [Clostridium pasteurianum DSM 525 = ATCC 6013]|uniref:Drug resistance transporter, EmrB/QacA subfamily n=1 Tax=Clostridium pasteurianum DSM 525 = ATCC 6013 TaxID=1262449 RepID=A0A0H3J055_CLOPA|nr:MFS transporter [Clostridium pasteurianum]AJA47201.1 tetracenomycin C resistance and export protein [Clostridium pasteurianum DSM 525 = ATCC 6013]AJA51189.1 tetracenomycin C resistance and export protein [Clostridium pasteurianum DSM 525 = ATCC 6013]AOZ74555.1 MFS transporter [Clostridium pasteurianum DSM 525 = ATCC 6013]AOZ78352.1 MFS transporter [Clostridium pasteurianum]ELP59414.1 Permease MDR type [Clostridium pasteurianum DSM 525 = ATCC 6013]